jgi:ribosome-associated toxin RatA of RatAB toxin-antitoxin module
MAYSTLAGMAHAMLANPENHAGWQRAMEIKRTVWVLHPALDMYQLVLDVNSYPAFLSWCVGAQVLQQNEGIQLASLEVSIAGLRQTFATRNRLVPGEQLSLELVEGPFRHLSGHWDFTPLGEKGSKVTLNLAFDFSSSVLSGAFRRGFANIADKLVYDFSRRADQVYGA